MKSLALKIIASLLLLIGYIGLTMDENSADRERRAAYTWALLIGVVIGTEVEVPDSCPADSLQIEESKKEVND